MAITFGDRLIDSGYYDITPEQEREIEAREECARRGLNPDDDAADGVLVWMVVDQEMRERQNPITQKCRACNGTGLVEGTTVGCAVCEGRLAAPSPVLPPSGVEGLRAFAESFHITVTDSFYNDVTLHLDRPHSMSIRLRNDSSKSWIYADLEQRRQAAISASVAGEADGRVPDRETFWLVERVGHQQYVKDHSELPGLTGDPWRAARFITEREAHDFWLRLATLRDECKPVEHLFVNKATPSPALSPVTVERCAKVAEEVQRRMMEECDFGAGIAAREIRALLASPYTLCLHCQPQDALKSVTIVIPSGYRDAAEFLKDCQFEQASLNPAVEEALRNILGQAHAGAMLGGEHAYQACLTIEASVPAIRALLASPAPSGETES